MTDLNQAVREQLINAAVEARANAYAPHSDFQVGAAVLTDDNQIVIGCNVENASYSLCICAERVAIGTAVANGHQSFRAIVVATKGGVTPCGACRQFMSEFGLDTIVITVDVVDGSTKSRPLSVLLPEAFDATELP